MDFASVNQRGTLCLYDPRHIRAGAVEIACIVFLHEIYPGNFSYMFRMKPITTQATCINC